MRRDCSRSPSKSAMPWASNLACRWTLPSTTKAQSTVHRLVINPIIYGELSLTFSTVEALDQVLDGRELQMLEIPKPALFLAGKAFVQYRRGGGSKAMYSAIFLSAPMPLLTRETRRYKNNFPSVKLIAPE
jgi:hypothetical protein